MITWRKSSYSGGGDGSQCVEVALSPDGTCVRDSKNANGPRLWLPAAALTSLVELASR